MCFVWTSKSGPNPSGFDTFDLEMCFAPQRHSLFRHLKFQKWSEGWLGNVLCTTTACTFSTSQFPKVVRRWGVFSFMTWKCASRHNGVHFFDSSTSKSAPKRWGCLYILTSKSASCHNGVQFFISHLARWLRTRRFSKPTFDHPEPQIIGKTQWIATFLPSPPPASSFFWLSPSLIFSLLDFSVLTLPTSAFPSLHIVGSLTSKLPSTIFL